MHRDVPGASEADRRPTKHRLEVRVTPTGTAGLRIERDAPEVVAHAPGRLGVADGALLNQVRGLQPPPLVAAATEQVGEPGAVGHHHAPGDGDAIVGREVDASLPAPPEGGEELAV